MDIIVFLSYLAVYMLGFVTFATLVAIALWRDSMKKRKAGQAQDVMDKLNSHDIIRPSTLS